MTRSFFSSVFHRCFIRGSAPRPAFVSFVYFVVSLLLVCGQVRAVEPWTDKRLTVTSGLIAWYDGSAESAARQAHNLPEVQNGQPLARWHDGSGARRDLTTSSEAGQPTLRRDLALGMVRFDGRQSYLSADKPNLGLN